MDERIVKAIRYISTHLDESLDLKHIARVACVSPFHFHRLFKQETTLTLKKFIESLKVEKAFQMLLKPEIKVQEVAVYMGYNDSETFSRAFKRRYRVAPDDLRKVVEQAMEQLGRAMGGDDHCVVLAFKEESPEEITRNIMRFIRSKDMDEKVLNEVKAFSLSTTDKGNALPQGKGRRSRKRFVLEQAPETEALMQDILRKRT